MKLKTFAANAARYLFTGITTTGVVTAVGLVSVAGAALISPALGLAVGAFVFGGVAEGEAFFQSISGGVKALNRLGKRGYQDLIIEALHTELELDKSRTKRRYQHSAWFDYYIKLYDAVKQFDEEASSNAWNLIKRTDEQKTQQAKAKKRLALMQTWLAEQVLAKKRGQLFNALVMDDAEAQAPAYSYDQDTHFNAIITHLSQKNWRLKQWIIRLGLPIGAISGSGFALLSSAFLPSALAALGISAAFVWPLIAAAGIGGAFLIFHNIRDMMISGWFDRCKNTLKKLFKVPAEGVSAKYVFKIVGLGIGVAALGAVFVLSFLGSFGLSWPAMKAGASLIPHLAKAAKWLRDIIAPVFFASGAVFAVTNSGNSVQEMVRFVRKAAHRIRVEVKNKHLIAATIEAIKKPLRALYRRENILQIIDPFRFVSNIILKLSVLIMYLGHVAAGGTGGDKFGKLPTALLATASAGNEALQDGPFFWKESKKTLTYQCVKACLFPLLLLSAAYQTLTSRLNDGALNDNKVIHRPFDANTAAKKRERITLKCALRNAFDWPGKVDVVSAPLPLANNTTTSWVNHEINTRFQKRIDRTRNEAEKTQLMNACNDLKIQQNPVVSEAMLLQSPANTSATLFSPKNERFVKKMTEQYKGQQLR